MFHSTGRYGPWNGGTVSGVIVHLPQGSGGAGDGEPDGEAVTLRLGPGEVARFGRGSATIPVELRLADAAISRLAGEIRVTDDHWQLTNHSATHSYLVENPEGAGEYLRVPPRRVGAPIPFEFSRVVLPSAATSPSPSRCSRPTTSTWTRRPWAPPGPAHGHRVLPRRDGHVLPRPRRALRTAPARPVPGGGSHHPQIVERLKGHVAGGTLTARAISSHIDYLAEEKLRIGGSDRREAGKGDRRNGKREGIVGLALRFGLVREEHLTLLPPQTGAGGRERQNAR